jgi:hypothetical protein
VASRTGKVAPVWLVLAVLVVVGAILAITLSCGGGY